MKLNVGLNISKLIKDVSKGKPIKPSNYTWATVSQSVKTSSKKK